MNGRLFLVSLTSTLGLATVAGCSSRVATLSITDYISPDSTVRYRQSFDEAYFDVDANRTVDIILHSQSSDFRVPDSTIRQVIHIRSVWESVPGSTVAEKSQINATVVYVLQGRGAVAIFEGGGSLFFDRSDDGGELKGTLELARLKPAVGSSGDAAIFARPVLEARFRAQRNSRRVVRLVNETSRLRPRALNQDRSIAGSPPRKNATR